MLLKAYTSIYNFLGILIITYGFVNAIVYQLFKERVYLFRVGLSQTFFVIEILNILIGASRSTYPPTVVQVSSRLYIIWMVAYSHRLQNIPLTIMLVCWNISDIIRYMFYLFRANWLKKARYNAFIVLYPVGIALEIYLTNCVYLMYKDYRSWVFGLIMLLYLPIFPYLYYHMIKQRKRSNRIFEGNRKKKKA